jgi:hypothetical protein
MADVRNIIVGAAQVFVSVGTGDARPDTTGSALFSTANQSARRTLLTASTSWRDVGYTNSGLEVSYEPGYGDVMVDQLLDAARLFKQSIKVMLKTELAEGTLQNLNLVFGQAETNLTFASATPITGSAITGSYTGGASVGSATLALSGGALGDAPVERSIVAVGQAPYQIATSASGALQNVTAGSKERVYVARRVVQIEASTHGLKRDSATVFPVQFRCLPDDADKYDGAEYGVIIDRIYTAA